MMKESSQAYTCSRCGTAFPTTARHTGIVRRDFVEEFLGQDFDGLLSSHETAG